MKSFPRIRRPVRVAKRENRDLWEELADVSDIFLRVTSNHWDELERMGHDKTVGRILEGLEELERDLSALRKRTTK